MLRRLISFKHPQPTILEEENKMVIKEYRDSTTLTNYEDAELEIFEVVGLPEIGQPIEDFTELIVTIKKGYEM